MDNKVTVKVDATELRRAVDLANTLIDKLQMIKNLSKETKSLLNDFETTIEKIEF